MHEDEHLDVAVPVANALVASGAPEWEMLRPYLQLMLAMVAQRTMDEDIGSDGSAARSGAS